MTLRQKLTIWFTCLVGLILGVGAVFGWLGFRQSLYNFALDDLNNKKQELKLLIEALVGESQDPQTLNLTEHLPDLQQLFRQEHTLFYDQIFIQLSDLEQKILLRSDNLGSAALPTSVEMHRQSRWLSLQIPGHNSVPVLYAVTDIQSQGQRRAYLHVGLSMAKTQSVLLEMMLYELLAFLISIVLSVFLGQWLASKAVEPMLNLTRQVQQMTGNHLFNQLDTAGLAADEIGFLAETFNSLLLRISKVFDTQKRFVADVSHEFHTPLTVIRGHAQLLQKRAAQHPELLSSSTASIMRESDHLSKMVEDLLLLTRLEDHTQHFVKVELVGLLSELIHDLQPVFPRLESALSDSPLWVVGQPLALKRLFLNLLTNAFKATQPDQAVFLSLRAEADQLTVTVRDQGCGIAAEHLPHLFERFYRVDHARQRDQGGSGIGLALVQEMVNLHQGSISVSSELGQGSVFCVSLPLLRAEAADGVDLVD